jgi:hypothetical protein
VAGEKVKPVEAPDGNRVPLLRPGFRPTEAYTVAFVFLHSGAPFAKKGGSDLSLPKMDIPISVLNWEVFLPDQFKVKDFGGDAFAADLLPTTTLGSLSFAGRSFQVGIGAGEGGGIGGGAFRAGAAQPLFPGQLGGVIVDSSGAVVGNAEVIVVHPQTGTTQRAMTDSSGRWLVSNIPSGPVKVTVASPGFQTVARNFNYDASHPTAFNSSLSVGAVAQSVEVTSSTAELQTESRRIERNLKRDAEAAQKAASPNVLNLQRRVSGVLPVRIDVPRAGNSYRFVRPLVVDEETKVTFAYKSK